MAAPSSSARSPIQSEMGVTSVNNGGVAITSANLPPVAHYLPGTSAYTTDLGPVYNTGSAWVQYGSGAYAIPAQFAAAGNGTTDDVSALNAIAAQANGNPVTILITKPTAVSSYSPPSNVSFQFVPGGYLKRLTGATVTYNSNFIAAGPQKIMDITNTGSYVGLVMVDHGYDEWFGASPLGVIGSAAAINASSAFAHQAGDYSILQLPGTYLIDALCYGIGTTSGSATAPSRRGIGYKRTYWSHAGLAHGIKFVGGSGLVQDCTYEHMTFTGDGSSVGVIMAGVDGYKLHRVGFENQAVGFKPFNETSGAFTEYCEALACDFRVNVTLAMEYTVGAGNNSFNGTGLNQRCTVNIPSGGTAIQIDSGAKVYNAPLDAQFWTNSTGGGTIVANNSGQPTTFSGKLSYENSSGILTAGGGSTVTYFDGPIIGTSDTFAAGLLRRSPGGPINIFSDASVQAFGGTAGLYNTTWTTGTNVVPTLYASKTRLVELQVQNSTAGFDFEFTILVRPQGYGAAGFRTIVSSIAVIAGGGVALADFSFAVDSSGFLQCTCATLPAANNNAVVFETTLDNGHRPLSTHITV